MIQWILSLFEGEQGSIAEGEQGSLTSWGTIFRGGI